MIYNRFPKENVPNTEKDKFEYGQKFALAIWSSVENQWYTNQLLCDKNQLYADGKHPIDQCQKNIVDKKFMNKDFMSIDWDSRVTLLADHLPKIWNGINISEFQPSVYAIDPTAKKKKNDRKNERLKMFYAKDFIQQAAQLNGGNSPIPLDSLPETKEQVEVEAEQEAPLIEETAEELLIQGIAAENNFNILQWILTKEAIIQGVGAVRIWTDPIEGIKIKQIQRKNLIHQKTNNPFFDDCKYWGEVEYKTVEDVRRLAKHNNINLSEDDLKKICSMTDKVDDLQVIKVLNFAYKTTRNQVLKFKKNRDNNKLSFTDRTKDEGTEKAYNPKDVSDISHKVEDIYDVWYRGTMIIGGENKLIDYGRVSNLAEYKGVTLPPFIAFAPRISESGYNSPVEKAIQKIDLFQELDYRIQHLRNQLRGKSVKINKDVISKIPDGNGGLMKPEQVLSFFFSLGIIFEVDKDEDNDITQPRNALNEIPSTPNHDLNTLVSEYLRLKNEILEMFGYVGADNSRADEKTLFESEPYRFSDNLALKDYSDGMAIFTARTYQAISSMLDNIFQYFPIREKYISMVGLDDVEALEKYFKNRGQHRFEHLVEMKLTREERLKIRANIDAYVQQGLLDPLDAEEILSAKSKKLMVRMVRMRIEARKQLAQKMKMQESEQMQNGSAYAAQVAAKAKQETLVLEFSMKEEFAQAEHLRKLEILEKEMQLEYAKDNNDKEFKMQIKALEQSNIEKRDMMKKDRDEDTRLKAIDKSYDKQQQLFKLKQGEISDINQNSQVPEIDLSTL